MSCVPPQNQNSFDLLASLDASTPGELHKVLPHRKNSAPRKPMPVHAKSQRAADQRCDPCTPIPRQNGYCRPNSARPPVRNNGVHKPKAPPCLPTRLQNQLSQSGAPPRDPCNSTPRPCIDSCPSVAPPCPDNIKLSQELKQQVFTVLGIEPPVTCIENPPVPPPNCTPTVSKSGPLPRVLLPSRSNQSKTQDNILSSTPPQRTVGREQPPHTPEVVSCAPKSADSLEKTQGSLPPPPSLPHPPGLSHPPGLLLPPGLSHPPGLLLPPGLPPPPGLSSPPRLSSPPGLPSPPGLSKQSGRGPKRDVAPRTSMQPVNGKRCDDQVVHSERSNGLVSSQAISPPPSGATSRIVKPPSNKDTQPVPPSPTISTSSLAEDQSGGSVLGASDTTFTSIDSNVSSQPPQYRGISKEICRNWTRGFPCYRTPCRFLHVQPDQLAKSVTQPSPALQREAIKTSVGMRDQRNNSIPRKHDPPDGNVEPSQKSEPLYAITISDHIKVRFDQGFEVREVVTGFESRWIHLGNIDSSVTSTALTELLGPYQVDVVNLPESSPGGKPVTAKVQFTSAADAIRAVTDLNGIDFAKRAISAKLAINNSVHGSTVVKDTDVQLVWECPFRVGYAGYDTLKEARVALDSLNGFSLEHLVVSAQLYEGLPCVGAYNVMFKHLPASMTEQDLRKFANSEAVMLGRPNYQSLDRAVKSIRSRLEEYGTVTTFDVLPPPYKDAMVKAWVHFMSPAEARAAQSDLDRRRPKVIGHTHLNCRHVVSISHVLNAASYKKMREDIGWLRWSWQRRYGLAVSIREKVKENAEDDAPAYIRLATEQPELLSSLKYEFEQLLRGETITFEKKPLWDDFLIAEAGRAYIAQMQVQYPGIQIQVQKYRRVISLWGPIVMRHRARQDIVRKIMELKAQQFWKIPLSGKLLGVFCSAELSTLQELLGPENCILDVGERVLVVRGNDSAFQTACKAVEDAQSRQGDCHSSSDAVCPVCFGEAVVPVTLACRHRWCRTCITSYLTSAVENKMFPLKCLGDDAACTERIPLRLSQKLLSAADFNAVIEAAFWLYVHSRPDEFHNCPTPDCTQVYRSAPPNAVLQCPSCLARICPACRIEYHDGLTCEERDLAEDKLFSEWTSNHDVKSCPGCKVPIERSEGCNHVTCTRCQAHICWECLATFPRGQGIYEHMRIRHGGIGL